MAKDYTVLLNDIKNNIKTNGVGAITGQVLQNVLIEMVDWYPDEGDIPAVSGTASGLATSEMFTRLLQKTVYNFSDVAPDGEEHITQLGAKLTAWCDEPSGVPLLRTYETNSGGANYRQGLALMFRSNGGTEKFTLCVEASDKNASVRRLLLLHHTNGDAGWVFADGVELGGGGGGGGGGDISALERQIEAVATIAVNAQTDVTEGDPQAGFDGFVESAALLMSTTRNWSRIVFVKDHKAFAAQQGFQYYSSWMEKGGDMTHSAPMAYGKRGKTHLLTTTGELYVRLADGSLGLVGTKLPDDVVNAQHYRFASIVNSVTAADAVAQTPRALDYDKTAMTFVCLDQDGNYYKQWPEDFAPMAAYVVEPGKAPITGKLFWSEDEEAFYYYAAAVFYKITAEAL